MKEMRVYNIIEALENVTFRLEVTVLSAKVNFSSNMICISNSFWDRIHVGAAAMAVAMATQINSFRANED